MKIAVCEDEKVCSDMLSESLERYFEKKGIVPDIKVFDDGEPLYAEVSSGERFDIIFMDLQLKTSDGMECAAMIRKYDREAALIFVTGIEGRAVEGYSVSAFDYIVKSSVSTRLTAVLDRYMASRQAERISFTVTGGETLIIPVNDILWIESDGRGCSAGLADREIKSSVPIGKAAAMLPGERFTEIHKSVYVQTEKIRLINESTVEMDGGKVLPMSRRKRKAVMSAVMAAVKGKL